MRALSHRAPVIIGVMTDPGLMPRRRRRQTRTARSGSMKRTVRALKIRSHLQLGNKPFDVFYGKRRQSFRNASFEILADFAAVVVAVIMIIQFVHAVHPSYSRYRYFWR